ncbi:Calsequestrin-1, partial [Exaiptasia diaphana]
MSPKRLLLLAFLSCFQIHPLYSEDLDEVESQESQLPHYLRDDGIRRVASLTKDNFANTLKHSRLAVVLFYLTSKDHPESEKAWESDEKLLELVGRVLQPQGITVGKVNIEQQYELAQSVGIRYAGSIVIFHKGKQVDYLGHRSADILVTFLHKMLEQPITTIDTKKQRKLFDEIESSKVVGFFDKSSSQYKEYHEAAMNFQPLIPFFVVTDKKQAKQFRLKKVNTLQFYKPFEKPIAFPSNKAITEDNIKDFIEKNKKEILAKIKLENIHAVWSAKAKGFLITAFVRPKTEEGAKFFSLVKNLARGFKENDNLTFVWVDPDPFPMMREYWQKSYKIDVTKPSLGVVDPKQASAY